MKCNGPKWVGIAGQADGTSAGGPGGPPAPLELAALIPARIVDQYVDCPEGRQHLRHRALDLRAHLQVRLSSTPRWYKIQFHRRAPVYPL